MKQKMIFPVRRLMSYSMMLSSAFISVISCDDFFRVNREGDIETAFVEDSYIQTKSVIKDIPDTNDFVLNVNNGKGECLYHGSYGDAPRSIIAAAGKYEVSALSGEFKAPAFDRPVYGDSQTVEVKDGESASVQLLCRQTNAGVKLQIASSFLENYPDGILFLKCAEGKLMYGYKETRIAYFNPGQISLMLSDGGVDKELLRRELASREILALNISAKPKKSASSAATVSVAIDTSRNWKSEKFVISDDPGTGSTGSDPGSGGLSGGKGSTYDTAIGIAEAKSNIGAEEVWVKGYVVGGDLSSSKASFTKPFKSNTNIVIAARSAETDRSACMSVQLQKGAIRDALNLVSNPELLGRSICLKGDIVASYYGLPGIQNITEYVFN